MRDGSHMPSSEQLLSTFLKQAEWSVEARDAITVYRLQKSGENGGTVVTSSVPVFSTPVHAGALPDLNSIEVGMAANGQLHIATRWRFHGERGVIPWLDLELVPAGGGAPIWLTRGLCAPEGWDDGKEWKDAWTATLPMTPGSYQVKAVFYDNSTYSWHRMADPTLGLQPLAVVDLPPVRVRR